MIPSAALLRSSPKSPPPALCKFFAGSTASRKLPSIRKIERALPRGALRAFALLWCLADGRCPARHSAVGAVHLAVRALSCREPVSPGRRVPAKGEFCPLKKTCASAELPENGVDGAAVRRLSGKKVGRSGARPAAFWLFAAPGLPVTRHCWAGCRRNSRKNEERVTPVP